MKQSGIEWIGEIPDGWEVKRLKNLFDFGKGLPITKENLKETGVSVISYGQIHSKQNSGTRIDDSLKRFVDESYLTSNSNSLVHKSDFIFADTSEDLEGCGNCVYVDEEQTLFAGYHTIIFSSKIKQSNKYLAYLFKTDAWRNQIRSRCNGVKLFSITKRILSNVNIVLPPIPKQESIAKMLDSKCAQIDSIIEESKKSIEEYKAWKQSVIFEAVTGKNLNFKKKDSGIDTVGMIPAEWELRRLRFLCDIMTGDQDTQDANPDGKYNFYVRSPNVEKSDSYTFEGEGILMAGDGAGAGKVFHHAYGKYAIHQRVYCFYNFRDINTNFFYYYISLLFSIDMEKGSAQSTVPSVRMPMIKDFTFCLPPLSDQESIAKMLDSKCAQIDSLIAEKESFIQDLAEYKKSLIFEVVTGKRSV